MVGQLAWSVFPATLRAHPSQMGRRRQAHLEEGR